MLPQVSIAGVERPPMLTCSVELLAAKPPPLAQTAPGPGQFPATA